jgi:parallel beta-helix repeat protein
MEVVCIIIILKALWLERGDLKSTREIISIVLLSIILTCAFAFVLNIQYVKAAVETIYIKADGSIDPPTAPISTTDHVTYTFTGDITACIVVERNNIIINGAGHTLQGYGNLTGLTIGYINNVTIKNTRIKSFEKGVEVFGSSDIVITSNVITNNSLDGVWVGQNSSNIEISGNNVTANQDVGVIVQLSSNGTVFGNSITKNGNYTNLMSDGVWITYCSNMTVRENNVTHNINCGMQIDDSFFITVADNTIANNGGPNRWNPNWDGILIASCSNCTISANNITSNLNFGLFCDTLYNSTISGNSIANNSGGLLLWFSDNNKVSGNLMNNNKYNLDPGYSPNSLIDASNHVNGKHVYYLINKKNLMINPSTYPDVGYLGLLHCDNVTAEGFTLSNNSQGILLIYTNNSRIRNNQLASHEYGLYLSFSFNNTLSGNIVTNCLYAIDQIYCSKNTLKSNQFTGNQYNFLLEAEEYPYYAHTIDETNTVDGKPMYYWANKHDMSVPLNAGYVTLINCTNITVSNLTIHNTDRILLINTQNSRVINNTVTDGMWGVFLWGSSNTIVSKNNFTNHWWAGVRFRNSFNNTVSQNRMTNISRGVYIVMSSNNKFIKNQITNCTHGFYLVQSSTIQISENHIANNTYGIYTLSSGNTAFANNITNNDYGVYLATGALINNKFYHNNFINNTQQVYTGGSKSTWDDSFPSGGNFWSDYTGLDTNGDGIGDTPYNVDIINKDRYPLMLPWTPTGIHDVAVRSISTSKTVVGRGYNLRINVTVTNQGSSTETFDVMVYANSIVINTFTGVTISTRASTTLIFTWDTTAFTEASYTISAVASQVLDETDTADNTLIDGTVKVTIRGDITGDFYVNIQDAALLGANWQKRVPPAPANVDINDDGVINIQDAAWIGLNWQKRP